MSSICIDGFNLALPKGSGIATYGRNLLRAANALGMTTSVIYGPAARPIGDNAADLAAIADGPPPKSRINKAARWRRTLLSGLGRRAHPVQFDDAIIWRGGHSEVPAADGLWSAQDLFTLSGRAFQKYRAFTPLSFAPSESLARPSIVHWTCPLPLHAKGSVNVVTIHDLIPLKLPHTTTDDTSAYFDLCRRAVASVDHVVTVSEQTKRDVMQLLGVEEARITNTYQAVTMPQAVATKSDDEAALDVERTLNLGWGQYFLYFGAIEPKKNLARLIEAHLTSGVKAPQVIVGGRGWLDDDENAFLNQLHHDTADRASRVRRYPYMPHHLLLSLIRGARGVVFPSLYEGFGLPVLEAMMLGAPVVTSNAGALPEVAGNAAVTVDPYDIASIRAGILRIDADEAFRAELIRSGRRQAETFSAASYEKRLQELYAKLT